MPFRQMVRGILQLDVQIQMHNNPGKFQYLNPVLKTDSQELSLTKDYSLKGLTCPTGTCVRTVRVPVDTRLSNYDGFQEIRIRSYVLEPDGNVMHVSINTIVDLRNGKPYNYLDRKPYERGKGWYTKSGYCEGSILSNLPVSPVTSWSPRSSTTAQATTFQSADTPSYWTLTSTTTSRAQCCGPVPGS